MKISNQKIILFLFTVSIVVLGIFVLMWTNKTKQSINVNQEVANKINHNKDTLATNTPATTTIINISDWKTYPEPGLPFVYPIEFKYPPTWRVETQTTLKGSNTYLLPIKTPDGIPSFDIEISGGEMSTTTIIQCSKLSYSYSYYYNSMYKSGTTKKITVDGKDGCSEEYVPKNNELLVQKLYYFLYAPGFTIRFESSAINQETGKIFDRIINTLKFNK